MEIDNRIQDFVHPILGEEITAIGGHYVFVKERQLTYRNRRLLYYLGYAVVDTSCCGVGGCAYALVPGFVASWKGKKSEDGSLISQVESIREAQLQREIRSIIQKQEGVQQVTFGV